MVFVLSACSAQQAQNQEEEDTGADGGKVNLRMVWWGSQERHDATLKVLDLYKEKNPNVTFETEFSGWEGYWDKLATQSAAQNTGYYSNGCPVPAGICNTQSAGGPF